MGALELPEECLGSPAFSICTTSPMTCEKILYIWSGKRDSNPRPSAWKADALPTELFPLNQSCFVTPNRLYTLCGGGRRIRTFVDLRPADLQSAPFNHSGTPPLEPHSAARIPINSTIPCFRAMALQIAAMTNQRSVGWSWRRDLNPRPAVYKTAALPTELRQRADKRQMLTASPGGRKGQTLIIIWKHHLFSASGPRREGSLPRRKG